MKHGRRLLHLLRLFPPALEDGQPVRQPGDLFSSVVPQIPVWDHHRILRNTSLTAANLNFTNPLAFVSSSVIPDGVVRFIYAAYCHHDSATPQTMTLSIRQGTDEWPLGPTLINVPAFCFVAQNDQRYIPGGFQLRLRSAPGPGVGETVTGTWLYVDLDPGELVGNY